MAQQAVEIASREIRAGRDPLEFRLELMRDVKQSRSEVPVILITAHGEADVRPFGEGAIETARTSAVL